MISGAPSEFVHRGPGARSAAVAKIMPKKLNSEPARPGPAGGYLCESTIFEVCLRPNGSPASSSFPCFRNQVNSRRARFRRVSSAMSPRENTGITTRGEGTCMSRVLSSRVVLYLATGMHPSSLIDPYQRKRVS